MKLPANHIMEYEGELYNWFSGDGIFYPERIPDTFWCWGVPSPNWDTRKAVYCGKLNHKTRELYDIVKLDKKD